MQSLIFVAVFVLVLCLEENQRERDADEVEECTALLQCIYPLQESGGGGETIGTYIESGQLDAFCQSVEEARACQKEAAEDCDDEVAQGTVQSELNKYEFVCSDEGRELIADLDGSPCVDNEALGTEAGLRVQECAQTLSYQIQWEAINAMMEGKELDKESFCPFIDEYANCAVDAVRDVCGDSFSNPGEENGPSGTGQQGGRAGLRGFGR